MCHAQVFSKSTKMINKKTVQVNNSLNVVDSDFHGLHNRLIIAKVCSLLFVLVSMFEISLFDLECALAK